MDINQIQKEIKDFWKRIDLLKKLQDKNSNGEGYFYMDGPPYANFVPHVGHIRNTVYKDFGVRYAFMKGYDVLFQPGFDTHGLPIENMVEKKLNLESKKDIEQMGVDKFTNTCKESAATNKDLWLDVYDNLGSWYSWKAPYLTYNNSYLQSGWWTFKQLWDKGLVYEGQKPVFWCPKCETALAGYEVTDSYIMKTDPSIIVKFKVKDKEDYLLVFTTTPWTLISNVALVVHPDEDYVKVETAKGNLILAKERLELFQDLEMGFKILKEFKGKELDQLEYEPIIEVPMQEDLEKNPKAHKVYMSIPILKERVASKVAMKKKTNESGDLFEHFVTVKDGTGIVHTAPGHGKTDNEVGQHYVLPEASPLDDACKYTEKGGLFEGIFVKDADNEIMDLLDRENRLLYRSSAEHKYPVCWRCKSPLIFRMSNQWFVKINRERMLELNEKVRWLPDYADVRFQNWVMNAEDWNISRQRYWGIPIPVWKCKDCGEIEVIESLKDLQEKANSEVSDDFDLHNANSVELKCKCGKGMKRINDIFDVWFDSGIAPWASLGYPFENKEKFEKSFPVSRINESQDQVRGWFYYLLYCSQAVFDKQSYQEVSMPGWVVDPKGDKMSKSVGNVVWAKDALDEFGADALRYYYMWDIGPYELQKFNQETIKNEVRKFFTIFWNLHNFVLNQDLEIGKWDLTNLEDKWIVSKFNSMVKTYNEGLDNFEYHLAVRAIGDFVINSLSREYVQFVRDRLHVGNESVFTIMVKLLKKVAILLAPVCPFISEKVYLDFKEKFGAEEESVHLCSWFTEDNSLIDIELEEDFALVQEIIQNTLCAREKAKIGVRWPIAKLTIVSSDNKVVRAVDSLKDLLLNHVNIKDLVVVSELEGAKKTVEANRNAIGKDFKRDSVIILNALNEEKLMTIANEGSLDVEGFKITLDHVKVTEELPKGLVGSSFSKGTLYVDTELSEDLEREGFLREVIRRIQDLRKNLGMNKRDRINLALVSDYDLSMFKEDLQNKVGAVELFFESKDYSEKVCVNIKGVEFCIEAEKV